MQPRVFVTGVGVVSSIGLGRAAFFRALEAGTSGISRVASFDATPLGRENAGEGRVRMDSRTVVTPSAKSPARSIADFTCALGIGRSYSMA